MERTSVILIKEGDYIVNIGFVDRAEHAPAARMMCFTVKAGLCLSAAFMWYNESEFLYTDSSKTRETEPTRKPLPDVLENRL